MAPCTRLAFACANRSTWRAELIDVIRGCRAIRAGSLDVSVRTIRIPGLRSIHSYSSALPNANEAVICWAGSRAPAFARLSTPSVNISDHTRRPRRSRKAASTASGTPPMPSWRVAAAGTSAATRSPMAADTSVTGLAGGDDKGVSASIA
jgi:hypothetical protein